MSRTGIEAKPTWKSVPIEVRRSVDAMLGSRVERAMRIWGGYSATPTFRLRLADGRRAFFKAATPDSGPFARDSHHREERVYRELRDVIAVWAPEYYGGFSAAGWDVMLLQDLGPKSAPPWTPSMLRGVTIDFARFHRSTAGMAFPAWMPSASAQLTTDDHTWRAVEAEGVRAADLAGSRRDDALRWFDAVLPTLAKHSRAIGIVGRPYSLLHRDVRSDNLRWHNRQLKLLDWPHPGVGPAEYDAALFAQSVAVEGGATPETVLGMYLHEFRLNSDALDASIASLASFFTTHAPQPEIPGLPRLRPFQRAQMKVMLAWAARRFSLPAPIWLDEVD